MANGDSPTTRSLTLPDTTLLAWPGVASYLVDVGAASATPNAFPATGQMFVFYEVSTVTGQGSWWLAVAPQAQVPSEWFQDAFGGVEALAASGSGLPTTSGGQPILRPASTLLWIPQATLDQASPQPVSNDGQVLGSFPDFAPPNTPGAQTRSLYLLDSTLMSWPGVGAYASTSPSQTPGALTYTPTEQALEFYEVSEVEGEGSWWLPVASPGQAPAAWSQTGFGGAVALQATGAGIWTREGGQARQRPASAYWWIPLSVQESDTGFVPGVSVGALTGTFPTVAPAGPSGGSGSSGSGSGSGSGGSGGSAGGGGAAGIPNEREPSDGPSARQAQFLGQRASRPGTLVTSEPHVEAGATRLASSRAEAVRAHRRRVVRQRAGQPMALATRPASVPAGATRRTRLAQPAQPGVVNWIPIGPSVVLDGQAATRPPVSGRVTGVGVSADGRRVYVGSANGGVWRSDDAGRTFYPLMNAFDLHPTTNHSDSLSVGALALDPVRPDRVYVGSGEGNISDAYFGVGPVVSDDGGLSWRVEKAPDGTRWFFALAVDPSDPERVVAGTSAGVLRRVPRNEGVNGLPRVKPQAYFVRYDSRAGAYSVNYWSAEGSASFAAYAAAALSWPQNALLQTFVNNGEPWLLVYLPTGSSFPALPAFPRSKAGAWAVFRIAPDGNPGAALAGGTNWSAGLTLMAFELGGMPYTLRYRAADGVTTLIFWSATGARHDAWGAAQNWPAGFTQLVPFVLGGVPHFIQYPTAGTHDHAMLRAWTGTAQPYDVWAAPKQLGANLSFMSFESDGLTFLQIYDSTNGDLRVARVERDGELTFIDEAHRTLATGLSFTPFTLQGQPRSLAYAAASGVVSIQAYDGNGVPVPQWSARWGQNLRFAAFQMGYEWIAGAVAGQVTTRDAAIQSRASAVVVARRGIVTAWYAAFWGGGIYRSVDGGANWARVGTNTPGAQGTSSTANPFAGLGRVSLAVQPTEPAVIYAQTQNGEVWRYDVKGSTPLGNKWQQIKDEPPDYTGTQGNYDLAIAVAPDNTERIYLGGSTIEAPLVAPAQWSGSIWRADVTLNSVLSSTMTPVYIGSSTHADIHALVFTPGDANALWAATDGGLFFSSEPARPKDTPISLDDLFEPRNTGLASMTVNAVAQHPLQDAIVFSGTQDNGAERYTGSAAWRLSYVLGDSGRVVVNADPAANGQLVLATYTKSMLRRSTDGGNTLQESVTIPIQAGDGVNFYAPLVASPATGVVLRVAFGTRRPWVSDNFGASGSWNALGNPLGNDNTFNVNALAFSPGATKLYAGLNNGRVYKWVDAAGWGAATRLDDAGGGALPVWAAVPITSIAVDPADDDHIYVTLGGNLGAQADGWQRVWHYNGVAWTAVSGPAAGSSASLLNVQANAIVARQVGPATQLFVGADVGLWKSDDGGANWAPFGTALPEAAVVDLKLMPERQLPTTTAPPPFPPPPPPWTITAPALLRAATHGRGVYEYVLSNDARHARPVQLYLRRTILDRGLYAVQDGAADPTRTARTVNHRDGTAFKVIRPVGGADTDTFRAPADITFTRFAELLDQSQDLRVNTRLRVFVQIDNRGIVAADEVKVMLLLSRRFDRNVPALPVGDMGTLTAPPALPAGYEAHVQQNTFVVSTAWNTRALLNRDDVRVGFPEVVAADLPADALREPGLYALLAIVHNPDNPYASNDTNVDQLTVADGQVALKYLFVNA